MLLLQVFVVAAGFHPIVAHCTGARLRLGKVHVVASWLPTSLVAAIAGWMFLVERTETVRQYAVGTDPSMSLWSWWVPTWLASMLLLGVTGSFAMATLFTACERRSRAWLFVTIPAAAMCGLGLATLLSLAPTA